MKNSNSSRNSNNPTIKFILMIMFALLASHETVFCAARPATPDIPEAGETKRTDPAAPSESKEYTPSEEEKEMIEEIKLEEDKDKLGYLLIKATQLNFITAFNMALAKKPDLNAIIGEDGTTALMSAAGNGRIDFVRKLIAAGANVDAQDIFAQTALYLAAVNRHADCVRELLLAGARHNFPETVGKDIEERGVLTYPEDTKAGRLQDLSAAQIFIEQYIKEVAQERRDFANALSESTQAITTSVLGIITDYAHSPAAPAAPAAPVEPAVEEGK